MEHDCNGVQEQPITQQVREKTWTKSSIGANVSKLGSHFPQVKYKQMGPSKWWIFYRDRDFK